MRSFKKILQFLLAFTISVTLLYIAFGKDPESWESIKKEIQNCNYNFVMISVFLGFLALVSRAMRWVILINSMGYKSTLNKSFSAVSIGYFSNLIIPRIGEITRCSSMSNLTKVPFNKLFGTVILERIIDFIMMVVLTFLVIVTHRNTFMLFIKNSMPENINYGNNILYIIIILAFAFLGIMFLYKKMKNKIKNFISGVKDGLMSVKKMKVKTLFIAHTVFIWFMYYLMTYVCFFSFDDTLILKTKDALYTMVIGGYGMMIPSLGGTGTYHTLVGNGLELLQVEKSIASAFTIILHGAQSIMTILVGFIGVFVFLYLKRK